jgi:hypothetical protein
VSAESRQAPNVTEFINDRAAAEAIEREVRVQLEAGMNGAAKLSEFAHPPECTCASQSRAT